MGGSSTTTKELKSEASQSSLAISVGENKIVKEAKRRPSLMVSTEIMFVSSENSHFENSRRPYV